MILQRLAEYYDRLSRDPSRSGDLPKPGYSRQKISFCVVLTPDGRLHEFQSLLDTEEGRKKVVPRQLLVPGQSKPSGSGLNPGFLWDNAAYMLGYKRDDPKPERTRQSFEAFRDRHLSVEKELKVPAFRAVCSFLRDWSPEEAAARASDLDPIVGNFGVFRIEGEQAFVHDDGAVVAWWMSRNAGSPDDAERSRCLITGRVEPIARLHEPKIKGVRGSQTSGALLVSFNDPAYESFGKRQSYNAPVSVSAAFKYANALNSLLARPDRRMFLGDATVVFWAERPSRMEEFMSDLFAENWPSADASAEDKLRNDQVRLFLSQMQQGYAGTEALAEEDGTRFYILGLSPNASRISVRFWSDSTVGELKARLRQHMEDVDLVGARQQDPPLMIRRIVRATGRAETDPKGGFKGYDDDSISPVLAGAVARAVLTGGPYPQALLAAMVDRIRSDGVIRHARIATIKACLVRNSRLAGSPKEVPVALDTSRSEPAYVTGRLFALLEKIQRDSTDAELNATIKDRYFSSASATPGVVFPRLIRLSQHHLAKLDAGLKIYYEKQLGEVMNKIDSFPRYLDLEDQGLFAVGYFHQRQHLFTSRDKNESGGETA